MVQLIKDSHYWSSFDMFFHWLDCVDYGCEDDFNTDYIRKGFQNAIKHGYDMKKVRDIPKHDISRLDKRRKKSKKVHP